MFPSQIIKNEIDHLIKLASRHKHSDFPKYFKELNILEDQIRRSPSFKRLDQIFDELTSLQIDSEPHNNS